LGSHKGEGIKPILILIHLYLISRGGGAIYIGSHELGVVLVTREIDNIGGFMAKT
jgi:hypothetical protein